MFKASNYLKRYLIPSQEVILNHMIQVSGYLASDILGVELFLQIILNNIADNNSLSVFFSVI